MKTIVVLAIVAALTSAAHAQSAGGGGGLGTQKSKGKTTATAKDLDRAEGLAGQARARLSRPQREQASGWAHGGSGWAHGGSDSSSSRSRR